MTSTFIVLSLVFHGSIASSRCNLEVVNQKKEKSNLDQCLRQLWAFSFRDESPIYLASVTKNVTLDKDFM